MAGRGGKGRTPTPTHMKIVRGDEERHINRDEPEPEPAALQGIDLKTPPRGLGAKAAAVWRRLAPDLVDKHVLTTWDVDLFAAFCDAVVEYQALKSIRNRHRRDTYQHDQFTGVGSQGQLVRSPYWSAQNEALERMMKLSARFGLSPSDRAGLTVAPIRDTGGQVGAERLLS